MTDFINGWYGTVFYTEKEQNLHVDGHVGVCAPLPPHIPIGEVQICESTNFLQNGFFCVENAVSEQALREARTYVNAHYKKWVKTSKRQDDWRCHLMVDLTDAERPVEHPALMNLLLRSPSLLGRIEHLTGSRVSSIFYSQVAFRTPLSAKQIAQQMAHPVPDYSPGAEYHLDGQANSSGTRFPDPWSVLVGIALVDICTEDKGNFTVFPGWHTRRDWSQYPDEKRTKTLPDLGTPTHVCLKAGDAVIAHVLLPHRGGKNTISSSIASNSHTSQSAPPNVSTEEDQEGSAVDSEQSSIASQLPPPKAKHVANHAPPVPHPFGGTERWDIPANTREMVFFRVRVHGVDYESSQRGPAILRDPWCEFPGVQAMVSSVADSPSVG